MFWNYDDIFSLIKFTFKYMILSLDPSSRVSADIQQMSVFSSHAWPASRQIYFP